MKKVFLALLLSVPLVSSADVLNLTSKIYIGNLFKNGNAETQHCFVQINEVVPNIQRGKYCNDLKAQMMFGLDQSGAHPGEMQMLLASRRTNREAEFHQPGTCAEVVGGVKNPWEVNRWGEDTTLLYNQVFVNSYKVNGAENHYTVIFRGDTKEPTRAMIYRVGWLHEDAYECQDLSPM